MKKLIIGVLICCVMQAPSMTRDYHVSPKGSDDNVGSKQRPFAILIRARDAILAVNGRKVANVAVLRKRLKRAKGKTVELHVVGAKDRKIKVEIE